MGKFTIIRYETRPDSADENQQAIERVFAELAEKHPEGLKYSAFRLDDGVTFIHIVQTEGDADPLPQLTAFQEFAKGSGDRMDGKPVRGKAEVIGSYNFLAQPHDSTE